MVNSRSAGFGLARMNWLSLFRGVVVRKYDIQDSSSCDFLQFIFVVKTPQYGNCRHAMVVRNVMPLVQERDLRKCWLWYPWSQTRMRTSPIEMGDPGFENHSDVAFVQGNHEIQAFPSCATD